MFDMMKQMKSWILVILLIIVVGLIVYFSFSNRRDIVSTVTKQAEADGKESELVLQAKTLQTDILSEPDDDFDNRMQLFWELTGGNGTRKTTGLQSDRFEVPEYFEDGLETTTEDQTLELLCEAGVLQGICTEVLPVYSEEQARMDTF